MREEIARWEEERPPHSTEAHVRECGELRRVAHVFLREEERSSKDSRPVCFEAAIGLKTRGEHGFLDTARPVEVSLPDGATIRARAVLDRVDQVGNAQAHSYTIWDYKTGSSRRYERRDPFQQGRHVQNALYLALAQARLAEVQPGARVVSFGYFFPTTRDFGERIQWRAEELAGGPALIASLCQLIAAGCFPFSNDPEDARYSDYEEVYGDTVAAARAMVGKLQNAANEMLEPFALLREGGE